MNEDNKNTETPVVSNPDVNENTEEVQALPELSDTTNDIPTVDPTEVPTVDPTAIPTVDPTAVKDDTIETPAPEASDAVVSEKNMSANNTVPRDPMHSDPPKKEPTLNLEQPSEEARISAREERIKKANENYKPPSKFKLFILFLFFALMIGYVLFLPDISSLMSNFKSNKNEVEEKITTGVLECELSTNTENLDLKYERNFSFTDNKLTSSDFTLTTRGDASLDEATLDDLANKCKILKEMTSSNEGVSVQCDYTEGKLIQKESFVYSELDEDELSSAYAEIGGTKPEFHDQDDMDQIEKTMNASGYNCLRSKK